MQPLERYGVIALLFLAVATVAVFLWNDESAAEAAAGGGFLATTPPERSTTPPALATEIAAGEQKPRGLKRQPRAPKRQPTPEELAEQDRQERMRRMADFSARNRAERAKADERAAGGRSARTAKATPASATEDVEWGSSRRRSAAGGNQGSANGSSKRAPSRSKTQVRVPDDQQKAAKQAPRSKAPSPAAGSAGNRVARGQKAPAKNSPGKSSVAKQTGSKTSSTKAGPGEYIIRSGDTLTGISQATLGRASRWKEIVALNASLNPNRLVVGMKIKLPDGKSAPDRPQGESSGGSYVVRSGDSLWGIAKEALGDGGRWREILDANPGLNADKLVVGAKLTLPSGASAGRSTKVAQASSKSRSRGGVR